MLNNLIIRVECNLQTCDIDLKISVSRLWLLWKITDIQYFQLNVPITKTLVDKLFYDFGQISNVYCIIVWSTNLPTSF